MRLYFLILFLGAGAARADDGVRLPASSTTVRAGGAVKVVYPFGAVTVPQNAVTRPPTDPPLVKGPTQAETQGRFRLSYELEQRGDRIVVRRLRVRVSNQETYHVSPSGRLREHEAMHVRINEREADRIESLLKRFSMKGTLDNAEKKLKARFKTEVESVRRLHADWDENHVFPLDPSAEITE